ncbi:MAG: hypothetical protein IH840_13545, partial [Candidatus Heimdallarchaeota archaeon]|nr:hypothetical protein [Candidatus Heimdallarchaeota archaeon]
MSSKELKKEKSKKESTADAFANFASSLSQIEETDKVERGEILKKGVEDREKLEKDTLQSSRLVTGKLSSIREEAGLSAFVGTSGKIKSPKFRRSEFIQLLAREVLLIGRDELKDKGGFISTDYLNTYFSECRDN